MESLNNLTCCDGNSQLRDSSRFIGPGSLNIVLNDEGLKIIELVNFVIICSLISVFGNVTNIVNIIIFYKQGFSNTVNIAFLGLAISDLCCLTFLEWSSICLNPALPVYGSIWASIEVMYMSGGWPHLCFCRITSCITAYITAERFISIALPLKVKQIVTTERTTLIICLIYIVNLITLVPEYATSYLGFRFVVGKNRTLVGILFTNNRADWEGLCYVSHALISVTSFILVIVFTFALTLKLKQTSEWRKGAASNQNKVTTSSNKERKTVKMVVLIATVLIICYIPGACVAMASFTVGPEFDIKGKYINICEAVWSVSCIFQSINSSVNIFVYYKMSSKYRQTFDNIFIKYSNKRQKGKIIM